MNVASMKHQGVLNIFIVKCNKDYTDYKDFLVAYVSLVQKHVIQNLLKVVSCGLLISSLMTNETLRQKKHICAMGSVLNSKR